MKGVSVCNPGLNPLSHHFWELLTNQCCGPAEAEQDQWSEEGHGLPSSPLSFPCCLEVDVGLLGEVV